jgi:hypothetical protein
LLFFVDELDSNEDEKTPETKPLTADELSRGLARLQPIASEANDFKAFNKRGNLLPSTYSTLYYPI